MNEASPTTDIQPELRETGAPCDKCGKPIEVGQVVLCYDDAGEVHADCERPFALDYARDDGEPDPVVLLGSPMRHVALSRLTFTTPAIGDMVMVPRVYLASRFSRRHECHALAQRLKALGYSIASEWVQADAESVPVVGPSDTAAPEYREYWGKLDLQNVRDCDWLVSLQEPERTGGRGGRHVEFGIAVALNKRLTIIGPRETVFHHLPNVEHFDTVEAFLAMLSAAPASPIPTSVNGAGEREALARKLLREAVANRDASGASIAKHERGEVYVGAAVDAIIRALSPALDNTAVEGITPRRPLDDDCPDGYRESDRDFVANNFAACVAWLESVTAETEKAR